MNCKVCNTRGVAPLTDGWTATQTAVASGLLIGVTELDLWITFVSLMPFAVFLMQLSDK